MGHRIRRAIRFTVIGLLVVLVAGVGAGLAYRSHRQHEMAELMRIEGPAAIDEGRFIPVRNTEQWISIRGHDRTKPVVLFLHGGPGGANAAMADFLLPLERDFIIVDWDQPGAGRTFGRAGRAIDPALTIEQVAADGVEVARFALQHLKKDKLTLLGMSWGSIIGPQMARLQPELFNAYVGTGQLVEVTRNEALAYERVLEKARARADVGAVRDLEAIGPPPYSSPEELRVHRQYAMAYETGAPSMQQLIDRALIVRDYSLGESYSLIRGLLASGDHFMGSRMDGPVMRFDLRRIGSTFAVPMIVIQGSEDDITPAVPAREYVESLQAPVARYVEIPGAGHDVLWTRSKEFATVLRAELRAAGVE